MTPFTATFIAVCIALIAVEIAVMMGALVFLAMRVRRAAESVEDLAFRVEESVSNVSSAFSSSWMRLLQAGASMATGIWRSRQKRRLIKFLKKAFFDAEFQRKKAFLKSLILFQDLKDADLGRLSQALHARTYHAGETIFLEGDIGRALFVLEAGKVELTRKTASGESRKIFTIEPGEFFGEMALLEQLPRTASAVALERSRLSLLYRSKLDTLFLAHPRIGATIMTHLAQLLSARLRRTSQAALTETPS